jgi:urease accessory protein
MIGMAGRLRLVVGLDGAGRCVLREHFNSQLHRVLQLIPGAAPEEGLVYLLNPTGGIVQGDDLEAEIRVEGGAHAIVTAPSATKVYRMDRGAASARMRLRVERGAVLEYLPEPLIPHAGARFVEELDLDVEEGARALAWEILAPGRAARGESLAYDRLEFRLRVREEGRTVLRERSVIVPGDGLDGPAVLSRFTHYGILLAIGEDPSQIESAVRGVMGTGWAGVTRLQGKAVVLKVLADDSREVRDLFARVREAVIPLFAGRQATSIRRS